MPEPFSDELSIFLRCARDELLLELDREADPMKPHRARRVAAAVSHLIARGEALDHVTEALKPRLQLLLARSELILKSYVSVTETMPDRSAEGIETLSANLSALTEAVRGGLELGPALHRLLGAVRDFEAERQRLTMAALERLQLCDAERLKIRNSELAPLTASEVEEFVRRALPGGSRLSVQNFVQPKGVYSKENYRFDITGLSEHPLPAILRRDRNFEIVPTSSSREFELLTVLHGRGLPVARCLAVQYDDAPPLGSPSLLMERAPGTTPSRFDPKSTGRLSPDAISADMLLILATTLARLHATPVAGLPWPVPGKGGSAQARFLEILDHYRSQFRRVRREPCAILEAAFAWLCSHVQLIGDVTTLVHGDYDLRNVLFEQGQLSAVLDFELSHLGHPAEDLGYLRKDIESMIPWSTFMQAYRHAGGCDVPDALVHYFEVWAYAFHGTCNVTAFSGYRNGVHGDVFLGTLSFIEFEHIQKRLVELLPGEHS